MIKPQDTKKYPKPKRFYPKNSIKYKGNPDNIWTRSSWETKVMKYLDENPNIIWWSSEELSINYLSPIDHKYHKYYPDFLFQALDRKGKKVVHMWEVKPYKQTIKPEQKRKTKRLLEESMVYQINQAKWRAADIFCQEKGWVFSIITENDLFK